MKLYTFSRKFLTYVAMLAGDKIYIRISAETWTSERTGKCLSSVAEDIGGRLYLVVATSFTRLPMARNWTGFNADVGARFMMHILILRP